MLAILRAKTVAAHFKMAFYLFKEISVSMTT